MGVLDHNLHGSSSPTRTFERNFFPGHYILRPLHSFLFERLQMQQLQTTRTEPAISALVLFLITLCSALPVWRFRRFINTGKSLDRLKAECYEDEDGIATEESETVYCYLLQRVLVVLVSLSSLGLLESLALAVITTQSNPSIERWLQFIASVCIQPSRHISITDKNTDLSYYSGKGAVC